MLGINKNVKETDILTWAEENKTRKNTAAIEITF